MNIIIPMAGMGKRMRPHTLTTAKPLIPVAGKPMVQRLVEDIMATCKEQVEEIAFVIAPAFGAEVEKHLLDVAKALGARGKICYQEQPLGTAHAILCAGDTINSNVFIAFADTLFDAQFSFDVQKDAIVWTQKVDDPSAFGVVQLNEQNEIVAFVEKPETFVSDQAIIGVYYFRDGQNLRSELQRLLDEEIKVKGEYQLTDAMDTMLHKGIKFYTEQVSEWLDCGNKDATLYTNSRMLALKQNIENLRGTNIILNHSAIIEPCYIGANVSITNSVVGPYVSIGEGCTISDSRIADSIVQNNTVVKNAQLQNSLLGNHVIYHGKTSALSLGDYSEEV